MSSLEEPFVRFDPPLQGEAGRDAAAGAEGAEGAEGDDLTARLLASLRPGAETGGTPARAPFDAEGAGPNPRIDARRGADQLSLPLAAAEPFAPAAFRALAPQDAARGALEALRSRAVRPLGDAPARALAERAPGFAPGKASGPALGRDAGAACDDGAPLRLAIVGPAQSGKTHLLRAIWPEAEALTLSPAPPFERLLAAVRPGALLTLDDADAAFDRARVAPADRRRAEEALFHLLNFAVERDAALALSARVPPARWSIDLPDLRTRLATLPVARITAPDDETLRALLEKQLQDRWHKLTDAALDYLAARIERSYAGVAHAARVLDVSARGEDPRLSRAAVAAALARFGAAPDGD